MHPLRRPTGFVRVGTAALGLAAMSALTTSPARAGGMALTLQNGSHLAQTFSAAASAEDASTVYFNPAGLAWLTRPEVDVAVCFTSSSGGFTNRGSLTAGAIPTTGGNGGTAIAGAPIPTLYAAWPVSDQFALGLGLSAPFGLATDYDAGWVGRYHALKSELVVINISPAFAWRPVRWLSIGAGFDWQSADAELSNAIDFGLIGYLNSIPGMLPGSADGAVRIKGDDTTTGFNLGVLYEPNDGSRIGLHYRSKMDHRLSGRAEFTSVPAAFAPMFASQDASAALPLPEIFSLSIHHDLSPDLALTGDWSWWNWSRMTALNVDFSNPLTPDSSLRLDWRNASIYSVGARWRYSAKLTLRGGLAFNESPVPSAALRTARIPDSDRTWLGWGITWLPAAGVRADFGYARLFFKKSDTANDDGAGHLLVGSYDVAVHVLSAQLAWQF